MPATLQIIDPVVDAVVTRERQIPVSDGLRVRRRRRRELTADRGLSRGGLAYVGHVRRRRARNRDGTQRGDAQERAYQNGFYGMLLVHPPPVHRNGAST